MPLDALRPARQPTSGLGECATMRRPEAGNEKVAVIWESLDVVPPSRYSQLRRWVNAGQAMLWSTWLSNPDILEVPDVVPDCFAGGASGDSHIFDRYRFGNQRGERGRGRPDNRDPGGGDRRGVHRHLSAVRRSCPGISGAQRPRGGISRPVRAYLDRRCRLIHGRRGRRRLASAGFAAGAAQRHQCTHPGAVGTPVDRRRHRCGAGERGGPAGPAAS